MPEESCFEIFPLVRRVEGTWATDPVHGRVEVLGREELTGEYRWRLRDSRGAVRAISSMSFSTRADAHNDINEFGKAMEDHVYEGSPPSISPVKAILDVEA